MSKLLRQTEQEYRHSRLRASSPQFKDYFMRPILSLSLLFAASLVAAAPPALTPPSEAVLQEARALVNSFKQNERGPYSRIRWFCSDGSVHPPKPYPCAERGGGIQHAEYSVERNRLAELGWPVGTVIAALTWEEIWQPERRHQRLRSLPLEHYMEAVDDGWVLRRARNYRGRVQLEDEEQSGRNLLLKLLQQPGFLDENFLLARELARSFPHGAPGVDRTRTIRYLAEEIAEMDASFSNLRIEAHSKPSAGTASRVRNWLANHGKSSSELVDKARNLADELDSLYGLTGRKLRLQAAADALNKYSPTATRLIRQAQGAPSALRIERLSQAMQQLRKDAGNKEPGASLRRLDLLTDLEAELRTSALERLDEPLKRRELLSLARDLLRASWGLGFLSANEREALSFPIEGLSASAEVAAGKYAFATRRLSLAAGWAAQTVRHTFAEPLVQYAALEPKAERFVDDLLRDSVLLPLGELAHRLAVDGAQAAAIGHRVFGEPVGGAAGHQSRRGPGAAEGVGTPGSGRRRPGIGQ